LIGRVIVKKKKEKKSLKLIDVIVKKKPKSKVCRHLTLFHKILIECHFGLKAMLATGVRYQKCGNPREEMELSANSECGCAEVLS